MSALAILSCRPNSHPFQERHISVDELVKIGRSVARARPAANNAIFDCKVLSRHHAVLWYDNNQFYLQDTKSSNGTFINNQRLCKGGEESPPKEVYSGDLIQFGVEVMENNRRGEKITHGCIIANITLYHPDGTEAKPAPFLNTPCPPGITIQSQDLYQLAQFLQEALHRENMLQQKLGILQKLVHSTQVSSEGGWQALIDEDKLLSRLEVLENQLHTYSKNHSDDALRQEIESLQQDKLTYETTAKESLRRVLQEKIEAVTKLSDLERSLSNTENECAHLKDSCVKTQEELQQLAKKFQDKLQEIQDLQDKLAEAEKKHFEEIDECNKEKRELLSKVDEMVLQESILSAKIESLQADNDIAKQQSAGIKAKMASMKELNEDDTKQLGEDEPVTEIIPLHLTENESADSLGKKLKETQKQIEKYKAQIKESDNKLQESNDKIEQLQKELEMVRMDSKKYIVKITSLEESLKLSDTQLNQLMENTQHDLKLQLKESRRQCESSNDLIHSLEGQIEQLESELNLYKIPQSEKSDMTLVHSESTVCNTTAVNGVPDKNSVPSSSLTQEENNWKALLEEAREAQRQAEVELTKYKGQLQEAQQTAKQSHNEAEQLRNKVKHMQEELECEKKERKDSMSVKRSIAESPSRSNSPCRSDSFSSQQLAKSKAESLAVKEENAKLKKRIQAMEAEMKMSRRENLQLSSEYNKLQESFKQLEAEKLKIEEKEKMVQNKLKESTTDSQKRETAEEVLELKARCKDYCDQMALLNREIDDMNRHFKKLSDRSKMLSLCSCMPLLMLLFAILMAIYPMLEGLTATES